MGNDTPDRKPNGANAAAGILSTLASSSNAWIQFGTLAMIGLTGLGNWMATWQSSDRNQQVIVQKADKIREEARKQIDDIHKWISDSQDEFHKGNIDSSVNRRILSQFKDEIGDFERRQLVVLNNQSTMLENQGKILAAEHQMVDQIHSWIEEHKNQSQKESPPQ